MMVTDQELVTLDRASQLSGVPIHTLRYWIKRGRLTRYSRKADARVFVDMAQLRDLTRLRPERPEEE